MKESGFSNFFSLIQGETSKRKISDYFNSSSSSNANNNSSLLDGVDVAAWEEDDEFWENNDQMVMDASPEKKGRVGGGEEYDP